MIINKDLYDQLKLLSESNDSNRLGQALSACQDEFLHDMTRLYIRQDKKELELELNLFKRLQKLLSNSIVDFVSCQVGILIGIYKVINLLTNTLSHEKDFNIKMSALYKKSKVKEVLHYLEKHPSAQHKVIAQEAGVRPNYLSQIMRELEDTGCVLRYAVGKRSFYELSLDGQAFLKKQRNDDDLLPYPELIFEEMGVSDKWKLQDKSLLCSVKRRQYNERTQSYDYLLNRVNPIGIITQNGEYIKNPNIRNRMEEARIG
ncbi:hypothetical protein DXC92_22635 [Clostridiales bacterium TF09-2AC]|nr:hypothetical protein DXC92_22635 [Clostridiales bacterium TF09-2AC]